MFGPMRLGLLRQDHGPSFHTMDLFSLSLTHSQSHSHSHDSLTLSLSLTHSHTHTLPIENDVRTVVGALREKRESIDIAHSTTQLHWGQTASLQRTRHPLSFPERLCQNRLLVEKSKRGTESIRLRSDQGFPRSASAFGDRVAAMSSPPRASARFVCRPLEHIYRLRPWSSAQFATSTLVAAVGLLMVMSRHCSSSLELWPQHRYSPICTCLSLCLSLNCFDRCGATLSVSAAAPFLRSCPATLSRTPSCIRVLQWRF